jgi:hypothetical protein
VEPVSFFASGLFADITRLELNIASTIIAN